MFEAINQDRSITRAADKLGLSQPAVSNALNRLRDLFEDPLFVRTSQGMEPTPKAELIASFFSDGLTAIRAGLASGTEFDPASSRRRFNLLMTDVGAIRFLPLVLPMVHRVAPQIDLSIAEFNVENYAQLLDDGLSDLAVGRFQLGHSLCGELIHSSSYLLLVSRDHPLLTTGSDGKPRLSYDDYIRGAHVMINARGASGEPLQPGLGGDLAKLRVALTIPHVTAVPTLIGGSRLIATLPDVIALNMADDPALCVCPLPFEMEANRIYQWWHKRNDADPGHRWLRGLFTAAGQLLPRPDQTRKASIRDLKQIVAESL